MNNNASVITTMKRALLACIMAIIPTVSMADGSAAVLLPQDSIATPHSGTQLIVPGSCAEGDYGCYRQPSYPVFDLSLSSPASTAERLEELMEHLRSSPYPAHLLKESGLLTLKDGGLLSSLPEIVASSVIAITSKAGKVVGTYVIKEGPFADHIQATVATLTGLFAAVKSGPIVEPSMVGSSLDRLDMFESSLNSLKSIGSSLSSLSKLESLTESIISEEVEVKAIPGPGVGGYAKLLASKVGLINFSVASLRTLYVRAQEYLYNAGLTADSIELYDDDGVVNRVAFIHMNIPAASKNSYYDTVVGNISSYFYGEVDETTLEWKSAHQPHIDIVPRQKRLPLFDRAFTTSKFLRNLVTLADTIPETATLRLFPGIDPQTSALSYSFAIIYLDPEGNILSQSPLIEIKKNWGYRGEVRWLTDKVASGELIRDSWQPILYNYLWDQGSLPVYNPIDADMLAELALAVASYRRTEHHSPDNFVVFSDSKPQPVTVKQSGHYLAALDAGGMVMYVDNFASQGRESPRIVLKVASIDEVDEVLLAHMEELRINAYPVVLRGGKPFDPARDRMEMAVLKLMLGQFVGNYADAGARATVGFEKIHYPDPIFADMEGSLMFNKLIRRMASQPGS